MSLDRRQTLRKVPDKFAFLQLERDDGGTVLDASEKGLRFETFAPVHQNGPVHFWFSLNLRDRIEAWGELVWTSPEKKCGGLRFLHLSEEGRAQIQEWMAEAPQRQVPDGRTASRTGQERTPGKVQAGKLDAVSAFVSKARPQRYTLLPGGQNSSGPTLLPPVFQNTEEQALGLVPLQMYLASKRKNLFLGILLGICISTTIAMTAFRYSNYRRQIQEEQNLAAEARTASMSSEVPPPAPAAQQTSNPASGDIFSTGNSKKGTSAGRVSQTQMATVMGPSNSHAIQPAGSAAPALPSLQPHSNENASQRHGSRTPAQLWAAVHAGDSKAAVELAELYIEGEGVPHNCLQARVLLLAASEKRNANAIKRLHELDKTGCVGE